MNPITTLVFLAGISQLVLALASLTIPHLLNWKNELLKLQPLMRQIFWTYSGYILTLNLSFGLLSALAPASLTDGSFLGLVLTLFIAFYWLTRIGIQFFYFDRKNAPKGWIYIWGEVALVCLFIFLTFAYGSASYYNCMVGFVLK